MSRGFDRVEDVWQLKIVQLFGAVRIPRRSFAHFFFRFLFHFYSSILFPFFLHFASSSCVPAFGHTRPRYPEPIVSKLAKSLWKNRALSNSTLSLVSFRSFRIEISSLFSFPSIQFFFFYYYDFLLFFYLLYELEFILFERNEIEKILNVYKESYSV